jgi:hypothetical protein
MTGLRVDRMRKRVVAPCRHVYDDLPFDAIHAVQMVTGTRYRLVCLLCGQVEDRLRTAP